MIAPKPPDTSIATRLLFHPEKDPDCIYLYEMSQAGGSELIPKVVPKDKKVRPGKGKGGSFRRRLTETKPDRIFCPLVVDTEYATIPDPETGWYHDLILGLARKLGRGSVPLSIQVKGIHPSAPAWIYTHPDFQRLFPGSKPKGLRTASNGIEPLMDYVSKQLGEKVSWTWSSLQSDEYKAVSERHTFCLQLFGHFLLADYLRVWGDRQMVDHLRELSRESDDGEREAWIHHSRRLRSAMPQKFCKKPSQWLPIPIIVKIKGKKFALELNLYDNSAMLGNAGRSYAGFHQVAGVALTDKDNFSKTNKERMFLQFISCCDRAGLAAGLYDDVLPKGYDIDSDTLIASGGPSLFTGYALGDVETLHGAIVKVADQFRQIYKSIGLEAYYEPPRPTTGSTVHSLLRSAAYRQFETAFAGVDHFLTKSDDKFVNKIFDLEAVRGPIEDYRNCITPKQVKTFPFWYYGQEESVPNKFRKFIDRECFKPAESSSIATKKYWSGINAKVFGGRIINNAPKYIGVQNAPIADVDLSGCYVAAMYLQEFPMGRPVIIGEDYERNSKRNKYQSLRKFLRDYRSELVPSLWQVWISAEDKDGKPLDLPVDQERFPSWQAPTSFFDYDEEEEGIWLERSDQVRIYRREITNCVINSDDLEWIEKVASPTLRNFILDKCVVKTAMFYPASTRCKSSKQFVREYVKYTNSKAGNTSKVTIKGKQAKIKGEKEPFSCWFSINLADLIADSLKRRRGEWKRVTAAYKALKFTKIPVHSEEDIERMEDGNRDAVKKVHSAENPYPGGFLALLKESRELGKHPLDELYKLCGNTVYGVIVSRFFTLSNPVVANNITARCRAMIWYYQAACRGWSAITDGGLMRLDRVFYPRREDRPFTEKMGFLVDASSKIIHNADCHSAPIGGYDDIRWDGDELVFEKNGVEIRFDKSKGRTDEKDGYLDLIDELVLEHTRKSFPSDITILKPGSPFSFETKGVVENAALHGAGNYYLSGGAHEGYKKGESDMVKMRSYSAATQKKVLRPFFLSLLDNPNRVDRSIYGNPFTTSGILKTGQYSELYRSHYKNTILEPGDTIYETRVFREMALSGFRFRNHIQEAKWNLYHNRYRQVDKSIHPIGQSFESFHTTQGHFLNYQKMVLTYEKEIANGFAPPEASTPQQHRAAIRLQKKRMELREMFALDPEALIDLSINPNVDEGLDMVLGTEYNYGRYDDTVTVDYENPFMV